MRSPMSIVLAGTGGQRRASEERIETLGVGHRVCLLGEIRQGEKLASTRARPRFAFQRGTKTTVT
ncbi:hypothetical protein ACU4GD_14780 [Cupriavidus basilensis]